VSNSQLAQDTAIVNTQ